MSLGVGLLRYTPTCVGKTFIGHLLPNPAIAVHPHVCGENESVDQLARKQNRYTPTCVGKTSYDCVHVFLLPVHPHVCGENTSRSPRPIYGHGTPPRVWGKHQNQRDRLNRSRYTPTCVGKTSVTVCPPDVTAVHPHVCGENVLR
jgi:hypothetical protein